MRSGNLFLLILALGGKAAAQTCQQITFDSGLSPFVTSSPDLVSVQSEAAEINGERFFTPLQGSGMAVLNAGPADIFTNLTYTFNANAGGAVVLHVLFDSADSRPHMDEAFVMLLRQGGSLAERVWTMTVADLPDYGASPWLTILGPTPLNESVTVVVGIKNEGDSFGSPQLLLDDVRVCDNMTVAQSFISPTPSLTASITGTGSVSATRSNTASRTMSRSLSSSRTPTRSQTASGTGSVSVTSSVTASPSLSGSGTPSASLGASASGSVGASPSGSTSAAPPQPSGTASVSGTGSGSNSPSASGTGSATPSVAASPSGTGSQGATATSSGTQSRSRSGSPTSSRSRSGTPSGTGSRSGSRSGTLTRSASPTVSTTRSGTGSVSVSSTRTPTVSRTPSPSPTVAICKAPVNKVTVLSGTRGSSRVLDSATAGNANMYTSGTCRNGFKTFVPGPRLVFMLSLGPGVTLGGTLNVTTCGLSKNDTTLFIGTGCPTWAVPFACLRGNDDIGDPDNYGGRVCGSNRRVSEVSIVANSRTYFIQVGNAAPQQNVVAGISWAYSQPTPTTTPSFTRSPKGTPSRSNSKSRSRKPKF